MKKKTIIKKRKARNRNISIAALAVVVAVAAIIFAAIPLTSTEVVYERPDEAVPPVEVKKDALDLWIDELAEYECTGCAKDPYKIIAVLDNNNKYSHGCLQFQEATWIGYVGQYDLMPHAEPHERMNRIYDCPFQKQVAKLMIEEDWNNWRHWRTSVEVKGLGYPPKE